MSQKPPEEFHFWKLVILFRYCNVRNESLCLILSHVNPIYIWIGAEYHDSFSAGFQADPEGPGAQVRLGRDLKQENKHFLLDNWKIHFSQNRISQNSKASNNIFSFLRAFMTSEVEKSEIDLVKIDRFRS